MIKFLKGTHKESFSSHLGSGPIEKYYKGIRQIETQILLLVLIKHNLENEALWGRQNNLLTLHLPV